MLSNPSRISIANSKTRHPGWERLLVMPHPAALLRASSSRANRPTAILDWL